MGPGMLSSSLLHYCWHIMCYDRLCLLLLFVYHWCAQPCFAGAVGLFSLSFCFQEEKELAAALHAFCFLFQAMGEAPFCSGEKCHRLNIVHLLGKQPEVTAHCWCEKSPALPIVSLLSVLVCSSFPDWKQFSADLALYSNFLLLETFPWDLVQGVAEGNPVSFI